jgi:arabinose-5-phosphate isomerase
MVISGIGKSAVIAQKMVATLNSTGTPALFMHAADAIHGDLGMIQKDDIVVIISKSGESPEIKVLVPFVKNFGNTIVAISGNEQSFLVQEAHYFLNTTVAKEACPNNLAPTTSTTAQLAIGDALAVCLLQLKGFTANDFAKYHPGGALGKRLYMRIGDVIQRDAKPIVSLQSSLKEIIYEISNKRLGATVVIDEQGIVKGIITDGDIRRMLEKTSDLSNVFAKDIMTANPFVMDVEEMATDGLSFMQQKDITQLVVLNKQQYEGILHIHDLLKEGIV